MKELERKRKERERIFYPLAYSPEVQEPETLSKSLTWVARVKVLGSSSIAFTGALAGGAAKT